MDTQTIIQALTPVVVPLVVALFKWVSPKIPGWSLPLIATLLGALCDVLNQYVTGHASNLFLGAALGLAGVGMRELVDQAKQVAGQSPPKQLN